MHRKKSYQLLICRVAKSLPVLELLNHFIKSSTVAYNELLIKKSSVTDYSYSKKLDTPSYLSMRTINLLNRIRGSITTLLSPILRVGLRELSITFGHTF